MNELLSQTRFLYLLTFLTSLAVSLCLTPLFRKVALVFNVIDRPHSAVKTHRKPTPYLGGLGIWGGWIIGLLLMRAITHFPTGTLRSLRGIVIGSAIAVILGFIDDLAPRGLGYKNKFIFQALAASLLIAFDVRLHFVSPYLMAAAISIIWVIGITNAFNIIDIMDGLSGSIALIASLAFLFIALPTEQIYVNFCAAALAGGCLGFLPYNLSTRLKVFMGDTGSLSIGFILAAVSMGTSYTGINEIGLFAPLLILAIPMYDTFLVIFFRWRKGQSPFLGSKDHFALRLEKMGFNRRQILLMTCATAIVFAFGAFLVTRLDLLSAISVFLTSLLLALVISWQLGKVAVE